jgi:hypothetical protein
MIIIPSVREDGRAADTHFELPPIRMHAAPYDVRREG